MQYKAKNKRPGGALETARQFVIGLICRTFKNMNDLRGLVMNPNWGQR